MSFSSNITQKTVFGNKVVSYGTYTSGGTTGGDIDTGVKVCELLLLQPKGGVASTSAVNETLPMDGSAVTVVIASGVDGYWLAIGV